MKKTVIYFLFLNTLVYTSLANNGLNKIEGQLDSLITRYTDSNNFMGCVLVAKYGNILLEKGYGYADIDNEIPNNPSTRFYIASITKIFTIACITNLKEKGLLKYNDPVSKYIPDYPMGDKIKIHHLIKHKSGIVDFMNERDCEHKTERVEIDSLINEFKYLPLNFNPGEETRYSNSGFVLLAYIVEKVSGFTYAEFLNKEIFEKLNMNESRAEMDILPKHIAIGYTKKEGKLTPGNDINLSQYNGSGNISSSIVDMYKWYNAVYKRGDISLAFQGGYHGWIPGVSSTGFSVYRPDDIVIIILSNYADAPVSEMGKEIYSILVDKELEKNEIAEELIPKYTGYYAINENFYMIIEKHLNSIIYYANDNNFKVVPDTLNRLVNNQFFGEGKRLTFTEYKGEKFNRVYAFWGPYGNLYKRITYQPDKSKIKKYRGNYQLNNGLILKVTQDDKEFLKLEFVKADGTKEQYKARCVADNIYFFKFGRLIFEKKSESGAMDIKVTFKAENLNGVMIKDAS